MKRNVVFFSRMKRTPLRLSYTFDLRETPKTFMERLAKPFDKYYHGIPWDELYGDESFLRLITPSTLMRQLMHADIVVQFKPKKYDVLYSTDRAVKDSIVLVEKRMMHRADVLARLKSNNNIVIVDLVDGIFRPENYQYIDGFVCCSRKAYDYYSQQPTGCPVFFVEHCLDHRLDMHLQGQTFDSFAPYYFGVIENFYHTKAISSRVTPSYAVTDDKPNTTWFQLLHKATFHYAVRPPVEKLVFKPFLKGFTAAYCNANMLIHQDDGDALFYLGEDYPYLIKEDISEEVVLDYLARAQSDFGGPEWKRGLAAMQRINEYTKPETIASQFWTMIQSYE